MYYNPNNLDFLSAQDIEVKREGDGDGDKEKQKERGPRSITVFTFFRNSCDVKYVPNTRSKDNTVNCITVLSLTTSIF